MDDDTKELRQRPSLGIRIGKYKILEILGKGGMGTVYRAHDTNLDRPVALKVLIGDADDEHAVARFIREARTAARLQHPNIVAVYDFGETGKIHFIATELIEGKSLDKLVYEHITPRRGLNIVRKSALALHHAHENGVVHRDVKPSNILIDKNDEPHVADFGLAKHAHDSKLTISGTVVGTPSYISPEQGEGKAIDGRADLYALGATLYHILTGIPPFEGFSALDILRKAVSEEPANPRSINPGIPKDVETIIMKCMEKNPKNRYANCLELARDIERYLNDELITARPVSIIEKGFRKVGRNPWAYGGITAAVLAFAIGTPIVLTSLKSAEAQRQKTAQIEKEREKEKRAKEEEERRKAEAMPSYLKGKESLEKAEKARKAGDLDKSVSYFNEGVSNLEQAIKIYSIADAHYLLGKVFRTQGKNSQAVKHLEESVKLDSNNALAYYELARTCTSLLEESRQRNPNAQDEQAKKYLEKAKEHFTKMLQIGVNKDLAAFGQSDLLIFEGKREKAIEKLNEAIEHNEYFAEAYLKRGLIRQQLNNLEGALKDFDIAITKNPKLFEAFYSRGYAYMIQGNIEGAINEYNDALKINPEMVPALHNRGSLLLEIGEYEKALNDFNAALRKDPNFVQSYVMRGNAYFKMGETEEAISNYKTALQLDRRNAAGYKNLGAAFLKINEREDAIKTWASGIRLCEKGPEVEEMQKLVKKYKEN